MLLLAAMGPAPLSTGAVRGLSTLRATSSFSLLTIRLAWLAEKMLWPSLGGGGEVAVGERRPWMESLLRARETCNWAPELRPDEDVRLSFMAERILPTASLSAVRVRSRSDPEDADSASSSCVAARRAGDPIAGDWR